MTKEHFQEIRALSYSIQNKGFNLEENQQDYSGALIEINRALKVWTAIKDTANQANSLKYRGYLLGKLHMFKDGKKDISLAIKLYLMLGNSNGVIVSKFDFCKLYESEGKFDSALYLCNLCRKYWDSVNNVIRTVIVNNELMNIYCKLQKYSEAKIVQLASSKLVSSNDVNWRSLIDFYYLSAFIYKNVGDLKSSSHFDTMYNSEISNLKSDNPNVKANYSF